jgi:L-ascorbate metabolism protein UlaG (beta-lactamase superfamily)
MIITYNGHASFKLKGKNSLVVTDPFNSSVGFEMPSSSGDVITVSHQHQDHNNTQAVKSTVRRKHPFIIDKPGKYEVGGVSVFGVKTYHDDQQGAERGINYVFTILLDGLRICHLGDLGHELTPEQVGQIGLVDILLCPIGGVYTINPKVAITVIKALEPGIVVPMHFKTPAHNQDVFGELATVQDFLNEYGVEVSTDEKLQIDRARLPEETEVVVLEQG